MSDLVTRPRPAAEPASPPPPAAVVRRSRSISLVWAIPLVAAVIAAWLAWTTYANQGPQVRISFETAEGLEPGRTRVKYRDVDVGTVETVTISPDLERIIVTARMVKGAQPYLTSGTRFWIVRPRVGTGGVSGLGTLVSGAYIELDPATGGEAARSFTGLEEPPQIRFNVPGRRYVLRADTLGSVGRGAPIYYRGIEVGQVLGYELAPDERDALRINVFVKAPFDAQVHTQTRFWNASGFSITSDASGLQLNVASLQALLVGGIEFETPTGVTAGEPAPEDTEFLLFADAEAAAQANYTTRRSLLVEFDGSARGLRPGAPVEVRGIRVGSVDDVRLAFSEARRVPLIQAVIAVEPERIHALDAETGQPRPQVPLEDLVANGLRAQLRIGNLLTGDLYVELDFQPSAPPVAMREVGGLPVIPSAPTDLEAIQASASELLEKIANLPLTELVESLNNTAESIESMVGTDETRGLVQNLSETLIALRGTLEAVSQDAGPLVTSLRATSEAAAATLRQAEQTFASLGPSSPLGSDLRALVDQLQGAARSIRAFADYLDRHPEALLRGRRGGYQ